MHLIRVPKRPAGHPVLRAGWIGPHYEEWKTFLDVAYWNVELSEDFVHRLPIRPDLLSTRPASGSGRRPAPASFDTGVCRDQPSRSARR
jgi:hypothetical protein